MPTALVASASRWSARLLAWGGRGNPIVQKELRGRMRGRRAFVMLTFHVLVLSVVMLGLYGYVASTQNSMSMPFPTMFAGQLLFASLSVVQLILVAVLAPALTASALSGERERQTYEMLRTTLLSPSALVVGKLQVALFYVLLLVAVGVPLQSLAFLLGGVTPIELVAVAGLIIVTAFFFGALGILCSAFTHRTQRSTVASYGVLLALVLLPLLLLFPLSMARGSFYGSSYELVAQTFFTYVEWGLACLNPFLAAWGSQQALVNYQAEFYYTVTVGSTSYTYLPVVVPLLSPWFPYTLWALGGGTLALLVSVWRVQQRER